MNVRRDDSQRLSFLVLLGVMALVGGCESASQQDLPFDVLLYGGTVYDGTGAEGRIADVAIEDDRIAAVGDIDPSQARLSLDVSGQAVAPGFINAHSWATGSLLRDGRSMSDLKQGVTTEVFGEGITMGPLNDELRRRLATSADRDFPPPGYEIGWTTLWEYLQHLEQKGVTPNVASFVGATTVRQHVLGDQDRRPTEDELVRMRELVHDAMEAGALGVGSRLSYAPASYASTRELTALARTAARFEGRYISHIRSEGADLIPSARELLEIADEAGAGATIYHLKAAGVQNWSKLDSVLSLVESQRAQGMDLTATMYPYRAGSTSLSACIPPWAHEGGPDSLYRRLEDPEARRRMVADMRRQQAEWENYCQLSGSPDDVLLVEFRTERLKALQGRTLADVAEDRGTDPQTSILDLVREDRSPIQTVFFLMSEENVRKKLERPWVFFGSDEPSVAAEGQFLESRVHPRGYGTFARVLGQFVRVEGVLSLPEAIRRMTSLPSDQFQLKDRGRIQPGHFADLVVFDPSTIQDHATYAEPHQYASGVKHVFVNGQQVLLDGEHTGALPGRALRRGGIRQEPGDP
jgi:N-acyl-D-amino-acid deacylase